MTEIHEKPAPVRASEGVGVQTVPDYAGAFGCIDLVRRDGIYGWAWHPDDPSRRLRVSIWNGNRLLASVTADKTRADLVAGGVGDGAYAFEWLIPEEFRDLPLDRYAATFEGTRIPLIRNDQLVTPSALAGLLGRVEQLERTAVRYATALERLNATLGSGMTELHGRSAELAGTVETLEACALRHDEQLSRLEGRVSAVGERREPSGWGRALPFLAAALAGGLLASSMIRFLD